MRLFCSVLSVDVLTTHSPSGFTAINDLAVAARRAVRHRGLTSVLVFDLDVHQGDGTAAIFHDDPSVRSNYTTVSA